MNKKDSERMEQLLHNAERMGIEAKQMEIEALKLLEKSQQAHKDATIPPDKLS